MGTRCNSSENSEHGPDFERAVHELQSALYEDVALDHVCSQHRQVDPGHHAPGLGVDGDAQRISQLCWMFFLKIIDDQDQELEFLGDGYRSPIPSKLQWRAWAADPEGITGDELLAFINDELFPGLKGLSATSNGWRSPARGARRVRGRLQLHEVRPADAPGGQQDQRGRLQQPRRAAALRRHLRADPERPSERRQRGRILHAACGDRVHGGPDRSAARRDSARSRLRHGRLPDLRAAAHARALRQDSRGRGATCRLRCGQWRRSSCRTCCA